jgi:Replicase family/Primase C terminal 1 (PriCT-1)
VARASYIAVREHSDTRYFQCGTALSRVLLEAPFLPRCSDDKTATRVRPREYAIRYPYMQVNRPGMVSWLIFDLDHSNALIWEDVGLPAPNLVVRNRNTGHSHLFYAIPPVCTTEKARSKPIEYMKAIYAAMAARLNADTQFHSGPVAKTPGHPWWLTWELHNQEYELGKLADYVDLASTPPWGKGPNLEAAAHSRHCLLFEELRYYAYSIVKRERDKGSFETFTRLLEAFAHNKNRFQKLGFPIDLGISSINATVKSVGRWTWDRYTGAGRCHRGVMQLDDQLPLQERQRLAALRSNEIRQRATESRIRAACRQLQAKGKALLQAAIAQLAGVSRQTVAAYKHILNEVLKPASVAVLQLAAAAVEKVKYAVHQVSAALGQPGVESKPAADAGPSYSQGVIDTSSGKGLVGNSLELSIRAAQGAQRAEYGTPSAGAGADSAFECPDSVDRVAGEGGGRARRLVDAEKLVQVRALPLQNALEHLGLCVARDRDFTPVKDHATERWHVSVGHSVIELLVTGIKWFDARGCKGGGGAIDLTMHLLELDFVTAVKRLTPRT